MPSNKLGLSPYLVNALKELKHNKPTPIQAAAIPAILKGQDILGIAPTGSGKSPRVRNRNKRRSGNVDCSDGPGCW